MTESDNIKPTLPEALREMASDGSIRTHSENCWQWHLPCAAMWAADMIEDQDAALSSIREVVDRQAEDEGLWGIVLDGTQPITEAFLQQELRHLHKVIEDYTHG